MAEQRHRWRVAQACRGQALPKLVQRCTASRRVSCALVEVSEDGIVAFKQEVESECGCEVRVVSPDTLDAAGGVDVFAASSVHAPSIRAAVAALGKPLVVLTVHSGLQDAIKRRISEGGLTVIAAGRSFADHMRVTYSPDDASRIPAILADDKDALVAPRVRTRLRTNHCGVM